MGTKKPEGAGGKERGGEKTYVEGPEEGTTDSFCASKKNSGGRGLCPQDTREEGKIGKKHRKNLH